jgi:hypothetical protein
MGYICRVEGLIEHLASRKGFVMALVLILVAATVVAGLIARGSDRESGQAENLGQSFPVVGAAKRSDSASSSLEPVRPHTSAAPAPVASGKSARHDAASTAGGGPVAAEKGSASSRSHQDQHFPPSVQAQGSCPPSLPRSECEAHIRASQQHTPSYPVTEQQTCPPSLSDEQCRAIFEAEDSAPGGPSFKPEECLRYYSREQCEAVAAEFERQQAAQQAGN